MSRYKKIEVNGKWKQLHRYIMECHLGHELPKTVIVHHKNNDPHDNRLENLEVMTCQQHAEHHNQKHAIERACDVCAKVYAPHPTKRTRSRTCSRECFRELASRQKSNPSTETRGKLALAAERSGRGPTLVLARWHPRPWLCYVCGGPAACYGKDGDAPVRSRVQFVCNTHCGHGNEDSWCKPLPLVEAGVRAVVR